MDGKEFIFLYPIPQIIDHEIKNHGWSETGGEEEFRKKYTSTLNQCIDKRYRQNGFRINFAIFNDCQVSDVIDIRSEDRIVKVGLDFKTHTTKKVYPNQGYILSQLGEIKIIRIAGFHMWDCVQKLARYAYKKGLDTLVDEDLTEHFPWRYKDEDFKVDTYPTINPRKWGPLFKEFMKARANKPWLWQNY